MVGMLLSTLEAILSSSGTSPSTADYLLNTRAPATSWWLLQISFQLIYIIPVWETQNWTPYLDVIQQALNKG